jgi:hypothetical protein
LEILASAQSASWKHVGAKAKRRIKNMADTGDSRWREEYQRAKAQWNLGQATEVCFFYFV